MLPWVTPHVWATQTERATHVNGRVLADGKRVWGNKGEADTGPTAIGAETATGGEAQPYASPDDRGRGLKAPCRLTAWATVS